MRFCLRKMSLLLLISLFFLAGCSKIQDIIDKANQDVNADSVTLADVQNLTSEYFNKKVILKWTEPKQAYDFILVQYDSPTKNMTVSKNICTAEIANLTEGKTYTFKIFVKDNQKHSSSGVSINYLIKPSQNSGDSSDSAADGAGGSTSGGTSGSGTTEGSSTSGGSGSSSGSTSGGTNGSVSTGNSSTGGSQTSTENIIQNLPAPVPQLILLNYSTINRTPNSQVQLIAVVYPANASNAIIWESADPAKAAVDSNGYVVIYSGGTTITATSIANPQVKAQCIIEENGPGTLKMNFDFTNAVQSVTVSPSTIDFAKGSTANLTVKVLPANAPQGVTWFTSNYNVVTVEQIGYQAVIRAVGVGTATIIVNSTDDQNKSGYCTVTVY